MSDNREILCDDEHPENNLGPEIPDPWSDPEQEDWPNEEVPDGSSESSALS